MNKTNLVIAIILGVLLVISIQVYRFVEDLPTHSTYLESTNTNATSERASITDSHGTKTNTPLITNAMLSAKPTLTCHGFERAKRIFKRDQEQYITVLAENSLFDGIDKMVILNTLYSEYGVDAAINFVSQIGYSSSAHENFERYKQRLEESAALGKIAQDELEPSININWWKTFVSQNGNLIDRANYTISSLPGVERAVWTRVLEEATTDKDFTSFQHGILQLAKQDYHPVENAYLLANLTELIMQSSYSVAQKQRIIDDLSAINSATFYLLKHQQSRGAENRDIRRLARFGVDLSAITFVELDTITTDSDQQLLRHWQQSLALYDKHQQQPMAKSWCSENNHSAYSVSLVSVKPMLEQGDYSALSEFIDRCVTIGNIMDTSYFVSAQGWDVSNVFSIKELKKDHFKQKAELIKERMPEHYQHIFSFTSSNSTGHKKNRAEQLSLLIKHDLYPRDPNIAFALRRLSADEGLAILKQAGDIAITNQYGASLVFNSVLMGNDDLTKALIRDGYPLTVSANSPDPLVAYLMRLRNSNRGFDMDFLELLVANTTQITRWHINAIHRLKLKEYDHVDAIIEAFPELYPAPPKSLIDIKCDGHFIEFG
ncbi:MAG: hypothetical protein ACPG8A_00155 [Psychrobium sp.]